MPPRKKTNATIEDKATEVSRNSKQARFNQKIDKTGFFWNVYRWVIEASDVEPAYAADSRRRDSWLREYVTKEPFLQSVVATVATIDKNRGWSLLGAEEVVQKYVRLLHDFHAAPDQVGWRPFLSASSQSYATADIGAIHEIEWEGLELKNGNMLGRLASLYMVDPAQCRLTGNVDFPLAFSEGSISKSESQWSNKAYFRIVDQINTNALFNGLGVCAVSRCLELAKILVALYEHDAESLLSKMPKGLLLLKGISEQQWDESIEARITEMSEIEKQYYMGVQVLASDGLSDIDAKLVSLSQIPDGLDREKFTNIIMYLYALAFKYDPREFWPVSGGQLGTGKETEVQHKKATGKGAMDFVLAFQENLQGLLPETIEFEFEARDVEGDIQDETLKQKIIANVAALSGANFISKDQARIMLAEAEIIERKWAQEAPQITTDQEDNPEYGASNTLDFLRDPQNQPALNFLRERKSPLVDFLRKRNSPLLNKKPIVHMDELLSNVGKDAVQRSLFYHPEQRIVRYTERAGVGKMEPIPVQVKSRPFYSLPVEKKRTDITDHDGSMMAIFIPEEVAKQLRAIVDNLNLPADALQELAENMHVILAYFPDGDLLFSPLESTNAIVNIGKVIDGMGFSLDVQPEMIDYPLQGKIQGYGIFNGEDNLRVLYASLDIPELAAIRSEFCLYLEGQGIPYAKNHGFVPHITLAYLPQEYVLPPKFTVPDIPVIIDTFTFVTGGNRYKIYFSNEIRSRSFRNIPSPTDEFYNSNGIIITRGDVEDAIADAKRRGQDDLVNVIENGKPL